MIKVLIILFLVLIFLQDLKFRAVYWFYFPILFALSFYEKMEVITVSEIGVNLFFLVVLLLGLTLYVSFKEKRFVNITKGFFSIGDILFLIAISPLFSLMNFVLFFTIGTFFTLLLHAVSMLFKFKNKTIPFAGYMSLLLVVYIVFESKVVNLINQTI